MNLQNFFLWILLFGFLLFCGIQLKYLIPDNPFEKKHGVFCSQDNQRIKIFPDNKGFMYLKEPCKPDDSNIIIDYN